MMKISCVYRNASAYFIVVSPNKQYMMACGSRAIFLHQWPSAKLVRRYLLSNASNVTFSPDHQRVVVTNTTGDIFVFLLPDLLLEHTVRSGVMDIGKVTFVDNIRFLFPSADNFPAKGVGFCLFNCESAMLRPLFEKEPFYCELSRQSAAYSSCTGAVTLVGIHDTPPISFSAMMEIVKLRFEGDDIQHREEYRSASHPVYQTICVYDPVRDRIAAQVVSFPSKLAIAVFDGTGNYLNSTQIPESITDLRWIDNGRYLVANQLVKESAFVFSEKLIFWDGETLEEVKTFPVDSALCFCVNGSYFSILEAGMKPGKKACLLYEIQDDNS